MFFLDFSLHVFFDNLFGIFKLDLFFKKIDKYKKKKQRDQE